MHAELVVAGKYLALPGRILVITVQVHSTTMIVVLVSETKGCAFAGVTASR